MYDNKISVIVPVYNIGQYLENSIKSLINQTYRNIEIILVDDGSVDNSPAICDLYAEKDNRIKVIHQKNKGVSAARNAGMRVALFVTSQRVNPKSGTTMKVFFATSLKEMLV